MPPKDKRKRKDRIKHKAPPGQPVSGPHGFQGSRPSKPPKERPDKPDRPDRHHPVSTPQTTKPGTSGGYQHPKPSGSGIKTGSTPTVTQGGHGNLIDSLAALSQTTDPKEQDNLINHIGHIADTGNYSNQAHSNILDSIVDATTIAGGGQTQGQIEGFQSTIENIPDPEEDPEKDPKDEKEKKDAIEDFWNEDLGTWDIRKARQNIGLLQRLTGRKIANITADGKIIFADQIGGTMPFMQVMDNLSYGLDKLVGFDPNKALTKGGMGDQGKAALYHKLSGMSPSEFRDFLNRKGNLDRIREFSGDMSPSAMADFEAQLKAAAAEGGMGGKFFADMIASTGGEDFQMMQLKNSPNKADRQKYYELNPHLLQTSGGLEEAARAGVSYIPGFGPVERPEGQGGGISDLGGGVGGGAGAGDTTTDTAQATTVPDYILRQQYMPGFTPDYTGGPEQMHIAGGYWDPVTQKWIGQGPWGTQSQYQFNQGGIVGTSPLLFKNQGGMVNDGGIKSFKKYGY